LEVYKVSNDSQFYKNIAPKLGDIYVAYRYSGTTFRDYLGRYVNVLDVVYVLAVKGSLVAILGKIDKSTIVDAYGNVLYDLSKSDPTFFSHAVGVSSSILRHLTQPSMIGVGKDKPGEYYETEAVFSLTIDADKKTIAKYDSEY